MMATFLQNVIALASAVLGSLVAIGLGVSHRQLCALISFAAGTLCATTLFHILPEALGAASFLSVLIAVASGYLLFYLVSHYLFHVCPACAASHFDEQTAAKFRNIALLLGIALGIHCVMDGMAVVLGQELSGTADRSIFLAVTFHKFPEGLALCALLLRAGFPKTRAFLTATAFEASTFLGWIFGAVLLKGFEPGKWFYLILAHVGGGFIYLAFHALINESREHSPRYIVFFFLLGMVVIGIASRFHLN